MQKFEIQSWENTHTNRSGAFKPRPTSLTDPSKKKKKKKKSGLPCPLPLAESMWFWRMMSCFKQCCCSCCCCCCCWSWWWWFQQTSNWAHQITLDDGLQCQENFAIEELSSGLRACAMNTNFFCWSSNSSKCWKSWQSNSWWKSSTVWRRWS